MPSQFTHRIQPITIDAPLAGLTSRLLILSVQGYLYLPFARFAAELVFEARRLGLVSKTFGYVSNQVWRLA